VTHRPALKTELRGDTSTAIIDKYVRPDRLDSGIAATNGGNLYTEGIKYCSGREGPRMTWVTASRANALVRMWQRATEPANPPHPDQSIRMGTRSDLEALPSEFEHYWADEFLHVGSPVPEDVYTSLLIASRDEDGRLRKEVQILAAAEREAVQAMLEFA